MTSSRASEDGDERPRRRLRVVMEQRARGEEFEGGAGLDLLVAAGVHVWQVQEEAGLPATCSASGREPSMDSRRVGDLIGQSCISATQLAPILVRPIPGLEYRHWD